MDNQNLNNYYANLISSYLSGNASEAQIAELEAWVLADSENKTHFINAKKVWMLSALKEENQQPVDTGQAWKQAAKQAFSETKILDISSAGKGRVRTWWGVAAAIILLMIISFWFLQDALEAPTQLVATTNESKSFQLADGSDITLNQNSSVDYVLEDQSGERQVILNGDAFFDVKRDEQHPFVVKTQNVEIKVLGTSFYVDSREDQPEVQVIVESGIVSVTAGGSSRILNENEKAIWIKETRELIKEENTDPNFLSLKTNVLKFKAVSMKEVAFALSRQFGVKISLEDETQQTCELHSTYTDKPLDSILVSIEDLYGLKPVKNGSEIILTGECK